MIIAKTSIILKRLTNKILAAENIYPGTNQTDMVRKQKLSL